MIPHPPCTTAVTLDNSSDTGLEVPVGLLLFNRPDHTAKVLSVLARVKPRVLLVVADGPRPDHPEDVKRCREVRALVEQVDWDCEVRTRYADMNLGVGAGVSGGCDWFFTQSDRVIVLEDDCVPDPTFFRYCVELLERYRDDQRVFLISGNNFSSGRRWTNDSYFFSRYPFIWGWAAWRRTWERYDFHMTRWPELRASGWLAGILGESRAVRYWTRIFDRTHARQNNVWGYQLVYSAWLAGGLCVVPDRNLVTNIGFGAGASHTASTDSPQAWLPAMPIDFPMRHPQAVVRHDQADVFHQEAIYDPGLWLKFTRKLDKLRQQ